MKRFLMAAIAVFLMAGTAVAQQSTEVKSNVSVAQEENAVDKLIALIKDYTKKINATKTPNELIAVAEQCATEMTAFEEKYADELMALEGTLTEAQQAAYEKKIEAAMVEFEAAIEKKTEELIGDYEIE